MFYFTTKKNFYRKLVNLLTENIMKIKLNDLQAGYALAFKIRSVFKDY